MSDLVKQMDAIIAAVQTAQRVMTLNGERLKVTLKPSALATLEIAIGEIDPEAIADTAAEITTLRAAIAAKDAKIRELEADIRTLKAMREGVEFMSRALEPREKGEG